TYFYFLVHFVNSADGSNAFYACTPSLHVTPAHSSITFVKKCLGAVGSAVNHYIPVKCCCPPIFLFLCLGPRFLSSGSCSSSKSYFNDPYNFTSTFVSWHAS
ncbi:hypothetical protein VCUG_02611, partial [Vavraia culicis subsp. floridensis]